MASLLNNISRPTWEKEEEIWCPWGFSRISGNVCTCIVIARNNYMHTATNYYLFSLAVSDMLTLIFGLPTEVYGIWEAYPWIFGESLCVFKSFLAEMTSYASVLTITAFTIERYVAICHPIKTQTLSNLSRAMKTVFSIWIISCLFALPYPIFTRVFPYIVINGTAIPDSLQCNIPFEWQRGMSYMFQISTFLFFVFPMAVIIIMYAFIGLQLRRSQLDSKHKSKTRARRAVVRMLGKEVKRKQLTDVNTLISFYASFLSVSIEKLSVAVVVAFFVQWAPFHAQRLMTSYMPPENWTPALIRFQSDLFYVSGVLYFCNSTINPILYNSMSKKFRLAFKRTLCRCCYSSEELLEVNGKTKSVYCSDKTNAHATRQHPNVIARLSYVDIPGSKLNSSFLKPDVYRDSHYLNLHNRLSPTRCFYQNGSTGKLNGSLYSVDNERCQLSPTNAVQINGFAPRAAGLRYQNSTNSSLVSFADLESDSVIELKSLSSCSCGSNTMLNSRLIAASGRITNNKRSSYL
ncbi:PK1R-like protein [Mya arenaria]|uniref:PK1R-like protein n=1 Tax=Mya arenaria TaxID=6604 RepID=A0ABY7EGW5_MYAAR|nr:PK1R-like protein [Mya arenaria]